MARRGESISGHQYLYRIGSPGRYHYVYKMPSGEHRTIGPENEREYALARKEHMNRLLSGREAGVHSHSNEKIAEMTGHSVGSVRAAHANFSRGRRPTFESHQLTEAHHSDVGHDDYHAHNASIHGIDAAGRMRDHHTSHTMAAGHGGASPEARAAGAVESRRVEARARTTAHATPAAPAAPERDIHRDADQFWDGFLSADTPAKRWIEEKGFVKEGTGAATVLRKTSSWVGGERTRLTISRNVAGTSWEIELEQKERGGSWTRKDHRTGHDFASVMLGHDQMAREWSGRGERATAHRAERAAAAAPAAPAAPAAEPAETKAQKEARLIAALRRHGHEIAPTHSTPPEHTPEAVRAAVERASAPAAAPARPAPTPAPEATPVDLDPSRGRPSRPVSMIESETPAAVSAAVERATSVAAPASRELSSHDPDFGRSEAGVREMAEAHRRGENPYLNRAKEVFEKVKNAINAERSTVVGHLLTAIDQAKTEHEVHGTPMTAELVTAYYKTLMPRARGISDGAKDHIERATGFTFDELVNNPPVNAEVERAKRGFAAKQAARLEPYISDAFRAKREAYQRENPGKTLHPTYNDLMTWNEWTAKTGQPLPAHATSHGRSQRAHPKEFFDTIVKVPVQNDSGGVDIKSQMPPAWLPLHLTPVWNYTVKKAQGENFSAYADVPRQGHGIMSDTQKVGLPARSEQGEAMFLRSLRKYVQFRGGEAQLIDIPANKLAEVGMTHSELFRSLFAGSINKDQFKAMLASKIIDPVALLPFVKKEFKLNKSFVFVVPQSDEYVIGETLLKSKPAPVAKSMNRIDRIREILRERA